MLKMLTFLYTSPLHIPTFDDLLTELGPYVPVRRVVGLKAPLKVYNEA
jgi:hypothetical protein